MSDDRTRLYERIHRLVTDQLDDEELRGSRAKSLQDLIAKNNTARGLYVEYMQELFQIASRLVTSLRNADDKEKEPVCGPVGTVGINTQSEKKNSASFRFLAAAFAASLLVAGIFLYKGGAVLRPTQEISPAARQDLAVAQIPQEQNKVEVATLLHGEGVIRSGANTVLSDFYRLSIGDQLAIDEGSVELLFDSGVEVLVVAPCQFTIKDGRRLYCDYGHVSARVGERGKGFVVESPIARITDLGTEFGVKVDETGQTEIAVFEGEIDLEFGSSPETTPETTGDHAPVSFATKDRLVQGEGLRIDQFGVSSRILSIDESRFPTTVRHLPPMFDRLPVISRVRDNIGDRDPEMKSFYHIMHSGLREDCRAFVDRVHEWNGVDKGGIPSHLVGADYVMLFNDDKFVSDFEIELTLAQPATVYVFISDDEDVPEWLSMDFVDTGRNIGLDEGTNRFRPDQEAATGPGESIDTVFSIWKREVIHTPTVSLGSVVKPTERVVRNGVSLLLGYNMYGVCAVALESHDPGEGGVEF